MIVDNALYQAGVRKQTDCDVTDLDGVRRQVGDPGEFTWVGLHQPSAEELNHVAEVYGLHPLAVEDALKAHQRPKLERYDDSLFLVLKTLWYVDADDAVETGEINVFVGEDFVVSVRHGEGGALTQARHELEARQQILAHGPSAVIYAICDLVVDQYEVVADNLVEDVDEVEASVFSERRTDDSRRIYTLKRELAEMRRAVLPLREPMLRFATGSVAGMDAEAGVYFRDVTDHLAKVAETIDSLDGLLSTAFDAHIAAISIQQNDDMRKISAAVGLVAAPTLVAGIYGMNFDTMPELHWHIGYYYALGLMFLSSLAIFIISKRAGWL